MKELQVIEKREVLGVDFEIYGDYDNPLFLAKSVAEWIEHKKPSELTQSVDENEKLKAIISLSGQNREVIMLTEDGLYEVLMQSRKPIAKKFKKEVKKILKDIRRHGMYATDDLLNNPDFAIEVFERLREERAKIKALEATIDSNAPKVIFADAVSASHTSILVGELAKILKQNGYNTGQQRLFEELRERDFLMKSGSSRNMPTQKGMEMGLFEIKETIINNPDGSIRVTKTPKITGKGQQYFINLFLKELNID